MIMAKLKRKVLEMTTTRASGVMSSGLIYYCAVAGQSVARCTFSTPTTLRNVLCHSIGIEGFGTFSRASLQGRGLGPSPWVTVART